MTQKVWFITGASRGLGAEVAKAALAAGEKVIATRRGRDGLNFAADHAALLALEMDVTDQIQIEATVKSSMSRFGRKPSERPGPLRSSETTGRSDEIRSSHLATCECIEAATSTASWNRRLTAHCR